MKRILTTGGLLLALMSVVGGCDLYFEDDDSPTVNSWPDGNNWPDASYNPWPVVDAGWVADSGNYWPDGQVVDAAPAEPADAGACGDAGNEPE